MSTYQPISCDLYDWLEIAASWQLPVTLTGRDGRQWADKIRTIEAKAGVEYLLLQGGERLSLAELATMALSWQGEEKLIHFAPPAPADGQ
ncbi:modulator protein [Aeromonas hydrophila]|uniref:Rho-binding antiterminator n=1 Tax=Aeromonas hydrophila TaxID=644 RepID=UPI00185FFBB1|nr:Rho-binding antiterminator [Aeromonas hydrophila]MBQ4674693.1 modulator protein [Aeromonas hydrophila]MBW3817036.1 modulator protein [Aeromonas hydrophila]MCF7677809.1 modulator protein [Aeromonas hydrophila]MCF7690839.1 modulator protein [Aeromonas hydrophila]MCF7693307.1 modulator protein [Aeromonas hydrophila]